MSLNNANIKEVMNGSEKNITWLVPNSYEFKGDNLKNFKNYFIHNNVNLILKKVN